MSYASKHVHKFLQWASIAVETCIFSKKLSGWINWYRLSEEVRACQAKWEYFSILDHWLYHKNASMPTPTLWIF